MLQYQRTPIKNTEAVNTTVETRIIAAEEDTVLNIEEIGKVAKVVGAKSI